MGMSDPHSNARHEERDMDVKVVAGFGLALVVGLVIVHFISISLFHWLAARPESYPPPSPLASERQTYTGPRLLVDQARDMEELRAREDAVLNGYGWIDRAHGVVRIPIDRAMELFVERSSQTNSGTTETIP